MLKFPITKSGLEKIKQELKHLVSVERIDVIKAITVAREFGDLSENAEYHAARERQGMIEARISDLESKIASAEVIDISKLSDDTVKFGAMVTMIDDDTEEEVSYHIVSEYEADASKKRISIFSPIARALIGKSVGSMIEVDTPRGVKFYEIIKIQHLDID